jgi:diadenosine tetraphosphate (Ap4A) HIT family hydrolase
MSLAVVFHPPALPHAGCPLCAEAGGVLVFAARDWRVIRATEPDFPAFYRVVWRAHCPEWTDLSLADRAVLMNVVSAVERVLREDLAPAKINLASLGNAVPHLHWHVVARFEWDSRWPAPVWAPASREVSAADAVARLAVPLEALDARVARAVAALAPGG